jgi:hypothetical protein
MSLLLRRPAPGHRLLGFSGPDGYPVESNFEAHGRGGRASDLHGIPDFRGDDASQAVPKRVTRLRSPSQGMAGDAGINFCHPSEGFG